MASGTSGKRRRRASQDRIERAFVDLLQKRERTQISVSDVVKAAGVNRSTFYANYLDLEDLADTVRDQMFEQYVAIWPEGRQKRHDFLALFREMKANPTFFTTLFKLELNIRDYIDESLIEEDARTYLSDVEHMEYHIAFFEAGLMAMIKKWIAGGMKETPEEIDMILRTEYRDRRLSAAEAQESSD